MHRTAAAWMVILCAGLSGFSYAAGRATPTFDDVVELLALDPSVKDRALAGEIVMVDQVDSTEKELAIGLVSVIRAPYEEVIDAVKGNRLFRFHRHILDFAQVVGRPEESDLMRMGFVEAEADEVRAFLQAEPGERYNLSAEEIERLRSLRSEAGRLDDAGLVEAANGVLRKALADRLSRYQQAGLSGIATYQRSYGDVSSPAEELEAATRAVAELRRFAPGFYDILQRFPDVRVKDVEHRFYVFKFDIAGRPGFVLSHRVYLFGERFALLAERHIYAPHFYNSMQMLAGVIPHEDGTVLFYEGRTYTDQVAGFGERHEAFGGRQAART